MDKEDNSRVASIAAILDPEKVKHASVIAVFDQYMVLEWYTMRLATTEEGTVGFHD